MLLTVQEATVRLGITRAALYAAMADGRLTYVEKYGKRLIDECALTAYLPAPIEVSGCGRKRRLIERHCRSKEKTVPIVPTDLTAVAA